MSKNVSRVNIGAIVERIKEAYGYKRNADVARHLKLEPRSDPIGKAIKRNSLDLTRVVEACSELSQDWLLYGRGPMKAPTVYPSEMGPSGKIVGTVTFETIEVDGKTLTVLRGLEFPIESGDESSEKKEKNS